MVNKFLIFEMSWHTSLTISTIQGQRIHKLISKPDKQGAGPSHVLVAWKLNCLDLNWILM